MKPEMRLSILVAVAMLLLGAPVAYAASEAPSNTLAAPESFAGIKNRAAQFKMASEVVASITASVTAK